jgi:hypothetical protein
MLKIKKFAPSIYVTSAEKNNRKYVAYIEKRDQDWVAEIEVYDLNGELLKSSYDFIAATKREIVESLNIYLA